jgi:PilZ domain
MELTRKENDRRSKVRFEMQRELRYKVTGDGMAAAAGIGQTINISSHGVAFVAEHAMVVGAFVELSIHWPVLLDDSCPMRLNVFGRVLRTSGKKAVCSIDKYEFRTAPRTFQALPTVRADGMLQRWAEGVRKGILRETLASA